LETRRKWFNAVMGMRGSFLLTLILPAVALAQPPFQPYEGQPGKDVVWVPTPPALVEKMHQQLISNVDALELQLRRQLEESRGGTIRNTDPTKVPAGYQDSVAEYYRKLSGGGH
jgi:hypothetical protein